MNAFQHKTIFFIHIFGACYLHYLAEA